MSIDIFTDGACSGNPGPGGLGVLFVRDGTETELCGGTSQTTNNRMEMMAAIEALRPMTEPIKARVFTDSTYVKNGITKWVKGWKQKGWQTSKKQPVKNIDFWMELDDLSARHDLKWIWVRGHNGHYGNERADELARRGMQPYKAA